MSIAKEQPQFNAKAAVWTVAVHALLLLLFFFITYMPPRVQPIEEMGMEVNLGTSADGFGTEQPMDVEEPAPDNAIAAGRSQQAENDAVHNVVESDEPDAPAVNITPVKKTVTTTSKNTNINNTRNRNTTARPANNTTPAPQQPKARYVYGGSTGTGGNSAATNAKGGSEGNTTGDGDRGVPGGTPGAPDYEGTPGKGNGISHNIGGRNIVAFPPNDAEFREGGRVTVRITVNRAGIITDKRIVSSSNAQIKEIALRKINSIRFNKSDTAPEEQFGNITFVFKTRS